MLEVRALTKRYGSLAAVDGISFRVEKGQSFGLLGPNGAGKTTAISIIVGSLRADAGQVLLDGRPLVGETDPLKRRIGYVPQDLALYEDLSAQGNLRFFGALYGLTGADLGKRIGEGLELVGLAERAAAPVRTFSGGMKRRLNLAAALLHAPDLLILDEPTVGVDPQSRNAIFENLQTLLARGMTLLYTTHYMEEVERLCDRVAILDKGKIVADETLANLHRLLPGENRLLVELAQAGNLSDGMEAALAREVPGVRAAAWDGPRLCLTLDDLTRDAPAALRWLAERGHTTNALTTERPNLEQVFLHLTGKTLRD